MGIPVIEEIIDGVKWLIDMFLYKLPKPLKFLMFLFMLIIFGSIISSFIHLTGVHCNSDREPMTISPLSFFSNVNFMFLDESDVYNPMAYVPETTSIVSSCVWAVCNNSGEYYWRSASECVNETIEYKLQSAGDTFGCVLCNKTDIYVSQSVGYKHLTYICDDDAVKIPYNDMNWFQQTFCDTDNDCMPPPNFYFDSTTGLYTCGNLDKCGINVTNETIIYEVDELLLERQADLLYKDKENKDYKRLIEIRCDESLRPDLTFYGINLFSYKIWLFLIVIYILVMVLLTIKRR